ncbi:hypothetical protein AOQ88_00830 [Candidatus Riesia sp. GBBU]|nr:hypothetical protein AOQ88_00830 [Candidatus Riesia sp. GBBU]
MKFLLKFFKNFNFNILKKKINHQKDLIFDINKFISKIFKDFYYLYNKSYIKKQNEIKNPKNIFNFFLLSLLFILVIWITSGFYTIKESDRGIVFRFGKYIRTVEPGLNWKMNLIEKVVFVNVETIREQSTKGIMLTSDENVIQVEMNVQYRVLDPSKYLFNVVDPDNSLRQAIDSSVRGVIGLSKMEKILTTNRSKIRDETKKELESIIDFYNMGISILDVNFQTARPPEAVKDSFDDVIAAREEEQKTIREAQAYQNEVLPLAKGNAKKIVEEAIAYKSSVVLKAKGEVENFSKMLDEYRITPSITKERLYIETMEKIFQNKGKVFVSENKDNIFLISMKNSEYEEKDKFYSNKEKNNLEFLKKNDKNKLIELDSNKTKEEILSNKNRLNHSRRRS